MKVFVASPRGFCAGVKRAVETVERALELYGSPVFVRHEIVHNRSVVNDLSKKGVVFVKEVDEVPPGGIVIFSAHGVGKNIYQEALGRSLKIIDATCPLVYKVHRMVLKHHKEGRHVFLIGHRGHPEVVGTMGQIEQGITLLETLKDVEELGYSQDKLLAYVTQTTLSAKETSSIVEALRKKYPSVVGQAKGDLCYATTNRQLAVEKMTDKVNLLLIVGSKNSSNSNRLMEIGKSKGVSSFLIDGKAELEDDWFSGVNSIGISSGASAPEHLVEELLEDLQRRFPNAIIDRETPSEENIAFSLPPLQ